MALYRLSAVIPSDMVGSMMDALHASGVADFQCVPVDAPEATRGRRGRPRGGGTAKRAGTRAKAAIKYRSRKTPTLKWSGRGMTPKWMREEMKGTKLKKDDFLIA